MILLELLTMIGSLNFDPGGCYLVDILAVMAFVTPDVRNSPIVPGADSGSNKTKQ